MVRGEIVRSVEVSQPSQRGQHPTLRSLGWRTDLSLDQMDQLCRYATPFRSSDLPELFQVADLVRDTGLKVSGTIRAVGNRPGELYVHSAIGLVEQSAQGSELADPRAVGVHRDNLFGLRLSARGIARRGEYECLCDSVLTNQVQRASVRVIIEEVTSDLGKFGLVEAGELAEIGA